MTRSTVPVLALAVLVFVAALALPANADAPAQTGPTGSPVERYMMDVYPDGAVVLSTLTPTTWATFTLTPSNTPIPSSTPLSPTRTPTPLPTYTATVESTPTQESTPIPTSTPGPTAIPKTCRLRAKFPINARADHNTGASITGLWAQGVEGQFQAFTVDGGYLWGRHDPGWSVVAVYDGTTAQWWADGTEAGDLCTLVEGWPDGLVPPVPIAFETGQGPHILNPDGARKLLPYCAEMDTAKFFEHAMGYVSAYRDCNLDLWIVCRFWSDDLARQSGYDAAVAWEMVGKKYPEGCNAVEPENEKLSRNADEWAMWTPWAIEFCGMLASRGIQCLMLGMGPGWPAFTDLQYMTEFVLWADSHPLPDGRYHGISSHASPFAPYTRHDQPWLNDPYITYRYVLMRDWWLVTEGFDLFALHITWAITETGLSDGYSGNWSAPYTCDEVRLSYWDTQRGHTEIGFIVAFHWWSFGEDQFWTDDSQCAGVIYG